MCSKNLLYKANAPPKGHTAGVKPPTHHQPGRVGHDSDSCIMVSYDHICHAAWEEKDGLVATACACAISPRESVYVWKLSVKSIRIRPIFFRIIERYSQGLPVELPSTP